MKKYAVEGLGGYPNELAHKLDDALELNAELLEALKAARENIKDDLYEAKESFQGTNIINQLELLLDKVNQAIAKAEAA